jgi:unsaturated chondroitin disaccharide hydrolase
METNWTKDAFGEVLNKIRRTSLKIKDGIPYRSIGEKYSDMSDDMGWWTNGFWPGILWIAYIHTKKSDYMLWAEGCEKKLDEVLKNYYRVDHDAGFLWHLSAVTNYKTTGDEESKRRGMVAASFLASRFNIAGNFIRAWSGDNNQGWAIIDCMMNLPLLYWASDISNDPRFRHIAVAHADMAAREFVREDGSVRHIVCFDAETGEKVGVRGGQGYDENSSWSRGTAWALYGFALSGKYTKNDKYIKIAKRVADFFISELPKDYIPFVDFKAPRGKQDKKDSTAASIAASGLLVLSRLVTDEVEKQIYEDSALKIIKSLYQKYRADDSNEAILVHGNVAYWAKAPDDDLSIIYGDYFFLEALAQLNGYEELF